MCPESTNAMATFETEGSRTRAPAELYEEPHWYACYTRARHEKRVDQLLSQRGVDTYLPLVPRERQWKDRKKTVEFPLFPGYLFGRFTLGELHQVLTTPGVSTVVRTNGLPTPIPEEELDNVRRFAEALAKTGVEPKPVPYLAEGQRVRVIEGPFRGVEGVVKERRGRRRVLVGLKAIGQGLEVDIPVVSLQRIRG